MVSQSGSPSAPADASAPAAPVPDSPSSMDAHRQRELKWMGLLPATPPAQARKSKKVKRLLLDGVPSSVRYLVWCHLTDSKARALPGVYAQLGKRPRVPAFADIERDVRACFPDQVQLHSPKGPLVSLLQAYLSMVPDIQYSSGLTAIAGHLLLLSPEEDAFWIFVSMMDAHLRPYFSANTIQVEVDSALLSKAIEGNDAGVGKKLFVALGISPSSICRPWFSTLYVGSLPVDYLHRIWDLFLYEGVTFLFRVGLALVQCVRHLILQATSEEAALEYLTHPPLACLPSSADAFLALTLSMKLKDDDVRKQRIKMEAQVKRQTQVRTLSTNGISGMQTASISLPKS
ncbi:RabGAP TBC [Leucogyrophana mollusca]|uniref:RabGAP TBC n=1 Tax=Leucogyrophana mollusca TaxID=85980 RepID=A0ACB8B3L1_9AGAM|nr:RabGAP TBC [Leucogyrophana mollusca]